MAKTVNRYPSISDVNYKKLNTNYFLHSQFKGKQDNKNDALTDPNTFADCKNIYIDTDENLVSRAPIKLVSDKYYLVDEFNVNGYNCKVYDYIVSSRTPYKPARINNTIDQSHVCIIIIDKCPEVFIIEWRPRTAFRLSQGHHILIKPNIKITSIKNLLIVWIAGVAAYVFDTVFNVVIDIKDYIYKPVRYLVTNDIEKEQEALNYLSDVYIKRYLYSKDSTVNFINLIDKSVVIRDENGKFLYNYKIMSNSHNFLFLLKETLSLNKGYDIIEYRQTERAKIIFYTKDNYLYISYGNTFRIIDGYKTEENEKIQYTISIDGLSIYCLLYKPTVYSDENNIILYRKDSDDISNQWKLIHSYNILQGGAEGPGYDIKNIKGFRALSNDAVSFLIEYDIIYTGGASPSYNYYIYILDGDNFANTHYVNFLAGQYRYGVEYVYDSEYIVKKLSTNLAFYHTHGSVTDKLIPSYAVICYYKFSREGTQGYESRFVFTSANSSTTNFEIFINDVSDYSGLSELSRGFENLEIDFKEYTTVPGRIGEINIIYGIKDLSTICNLTLPFEVYDAVKIVSSSEYDVRYALKDQSYRKLIEIETNGNSIWYTNKDIHNIFIIKNQFYDANTLYNIPIDNIDKVLYFDKDNLVVLKDNVIYTNVIDDNGFIIDDIEGSGYNLVPPDYDTIIDKAYYAYNNNNNNIVIPNEDRYDLDFQRENIDRFLLYFPTENKQSFLSKITNLHRLSDNIIAIFTETDIWYISSTTENGKTLYYAAKKTKLPIGLRDGDDVVTMLDGQAILLPTPRGIAMLAPQDFVATTDMQISYLSDNIQGTYEKFFEDKDYVQAYTPKLNPFHFSLELKQVSLPIKMRVYKYWIIFYKYLSNKCLWYDTRNNSWWPIEVKYPIQNIVCKDRPIFTFYITPNLTDVAVKNNTGKFTILPLKGMKFLYCNKEMNIEYTNELPDILLNEMSYDDTLIGFDTGYNYYPAINHDVKRISDTNYLMGIPMKDIDWYFVSQKLNFGQPVNYKKILAMYMTNKGDDGVSVELSTKAYRDSYHPEKTLVMQENVNDIRTFVKRMNVMHVTDFQYEIKQDKTADIQKRFRLNSLSIKYEIKEVIR